MVKWPTKSRSGKGKQKSVVAMGKWKVKQGILFSVTVLCPEKYIDVVWNGSIWIPYLTAVIDDILHLWTGEDPLNTSVSENHQYNQSRAAKWKISVIFRSWYYKEEYGNGHKARYRPAHNSNN